MHHRSPREQTLSQTRVDSAFTTIATIAGVSSHQPCLREMQGSIIVVVVVVHIRRYAEYGGILSLR